MLARRVLPFCNQAIHGGEVSREQALDVIGAAGVLARDYLAWLSWGFDDDWKPKSLATPENMSRGLRKISVQQG
jgi:hypothetical protein